MLYSRARIERTTAMDPSPTSSGAVSPDETSAPRIVVVLETAVPSTVHEACADLAAGLADRLRMPVTLAAIPACCLDALRPALTRARESRISEYRPAPPPGPMSAAPVPAARRRPAGLGRHVGKLLRARALRRPAAPRARTVPCALPRRPDIADASDQAMLDELRRGIWETDGALCGSGGAGLARRDL
jgi:hypothetical protein